MRNGLIQKKIITTNLWSSELSKLVANAFLDREYLLLILFLLMRINWSKYPRSKKAIGSDTRIGRKVS